MTYTDLAPKAWLGGQTRPKRGHKRHSDSDGFLYNLSRYKTHIALGLLAVLGSAKAAMSVADYVSKSNTINNPAAYSKSQPVQTAQTPESRLEQIAQQNNIVIPPAQANVPVQNAVQQQLPQAENKSKAEAPVKEIKTPGVSIDVLADYISQTYKGWTKKDMPGKVADDYSGWIIKYAEKYDIPVTLLTAAIAHETRFNNKDGDTKNYVNGVYNPSEGICQIGRLTQKGLRRIMKSKGESIPLGYEDLKGNPELAIHMMAFYLDHLRDTKGISLWRALGHYNGGGFMNGAYANKVMGEQKKAEAFFSAHKPGKNL